MLIEVYVRHDYLGRSSGKGSFMIWTHHVKNITFHDSFTPTDATDSVTYENGLFFTFWWNLDFPLIRTCV
jgi:hypothetical protein